MADTDRPMYSKTSDLPLYSKATNLPMWGDPAKCFCCGPVCNPCCKTQGAATVSIAPADCGGEGTCCEDGTGVYLFDRCDDNGTECSWHWEYDDSHALGWPWELVIIYHRVEVKWCAILGNVGLSCSYGQDADDCPFGGVAPTHTLIGEGISCNAETGVLTAAFDLVGDGGCAACTASVVT